MIDRSELDTLPFPLSVADLDRGAASSSSVRLDVAALSHAGRVRETNEDHYIPDDEADPRDGG